MIKMRINKNEKSECENCGVNWEYTSAMYDLMLVGSVHTICRQCSQELFQKLLKAECMQNAKIKSNEDIKRIQREKARIYKKENIN